MHLNLFKKSKDTFNERKDREPVFKACYKETCYEGYILSDKECVLYRKYRFVTGESPCDDSYYALTDIKKERIVPAAFLDSLCAFVEFAGIEDLCRRIEESDDGSTRILWPDEFQVIIKHKGVEISHSSQRVNYEALNDKQVIQEIKSLFFDIDLFFNTVFELSDDQLMDICRNKGWL